MGFRIIIQVFGRGKGKRNPKIFEIDVFFSAHAPKNFPFFGRGVQNFFNLTIFLAVTTKNLGDNTFNSHFPPFWRGGGIFLSLDLPLLKMRLYVYRIKKINYFKKTSSPQKFKKSFHFFFFKFSFIQILFLFLSTIFFIWTLK